MPSKEVLQLPIRIHGELPPIPNQLRNDTAMRRKEIEDLIISALTLAAAFGISLSGGYSAFSNPKTLVSTCLIALIAVSSGFILHEMGHRFMARRFGCVAEYAMWPTGLMIALVSSLFGFIFASPGAVVIRSGIDPSGKPTLTKEKNGQISITGPVMNICLAVVFMLLDAVYPTLLFSLGAYINTWLAIFNLIPFSPLDGMAVFKWNKMVWLIAVAASTVLYAIQHFIL
jgi:Zn-dependent protease